MPFARTIILGILSSFWCYGQNEGRELAFSLASYTIESVDSLETMTCQDYQRLRRNIDQFNQGQVSRAWIIADSLNNLHAPCYEFFVDQQNATQLDDVMESSTDCDYEYRSHENLSVNSTINIYRKRKFQSDSNGATQSSFCEEDF